MRGYVITTPYGQVPLAASSPSGVPPFLGSTGAIRLNTPMVGMASWLKHRWPWPGRGDASPLPSTINFADDLLSQVDRRLLAVMLLKINDLYAT